MALAQHAVLKMVTQVAVEVLSSVLNLGSLRPIVLMAKMLKIWSSPARLRVQEPLLLFGATGVVTRAKSPIPAPWTGPMWVKLQAQTLATSVATQELKYSNRQNLREQCRLQLHRQSQVSLASSMTASEEARATLLRARVSHR